MTTQQQPPELRVKDVLLTDHHLVVLLEDERSIMVPLWWYPRLSLAAPEEREKWRLTSDRRAITWDDLDEDLSARGLLSEKARPAPVPKNLRSNDVPP